MAPFTGCAPLMRGLRKSPLVTGLRFPFFFLFLFLLRVRGGRVGACQGRVPGASIRGRGGRRVRPRVGWRAPRASSPPGPARSVAGTWHVRARGHVVTCHVSREVTFAVTWRTAPPPPQSRRSRTREFSASGLVIRYTAERQRWRTARMHVYTCVYTHAHFGGALEVGARPSPVNRKPASSEKGPVHAAVVRACGEVLRGV